MEERWAVAAANAGVLFASGSNRAAAGMQSRPATTIIDDRRAAVARLNMSPAQPSRGRAPCFAYSSETRWSEPNCLSSTRSPPRCDAISSSRLRHARSSACRKFRLYERYGRNGLKVLSQPSRRSTSVYWRWGSASSRMLNASRSMMRQKQLTSTSDRAWPATRGNCRHAGRGQQEGCECHEHRGKRKAPGGKRMQTLSMIPRTCAHVK